MAKLHKAGLISASEGKGSGYLISKSGGRTSLLQVLHALSERPVNQKWRSGEINRPCQISSGMAEVMDEVYSEMNRCCCDYLATRTISDIDGRLTSDKQKQNRNDFTTGAGDEK